MSVSHNWEVTCAITLIMGGCMSNMHTLELLVRWHKGCGILVTFSHMVAISCFAACENIDWQKRRFKDRKVPLSKYGVLVLLFFVVQTLNNKAFAFDISIPLHLVFRSGSTMASLLVGSVYLNRTYSFQTVLAVAVTTCGVVTTTFASAPIPSSTHQDDSGYLWWLCGVAVMSLTLLISAGMGAYQDLLYQSLNLAKTEVPWQETLFYTHVLSIPVFGLVSQDILHHAVHIPRHIHIALLLLELTCYGAAAVMTRFGCLCWGSSHEEWCCLY